MFKLFIFLNELTDSILSQQIPPISLPNIFRDSLETDVLADVLKVLKNEFITNGDSVMPWLMNLSHIKRIGAVVMFLSKDQKNGTC